MSKDFIINEVDTCLTKNIVTNEILPKPISGCINRNFCSSFLFLFPALYGYSIDYQAVVICSILCLITSTTHHYYQAQHIIYQIIDRICVNSIAIFFILHCIIKIGYIFYAKLMYIFAILALLTYVYIHYYHNELYKSCYFFVHIFAISGIMFYIKAYNDCLSNVA